MGEGNSASAEWRRAVDQARMDTEDRHTGARSAAPWQPEVWTRDDGEDGGAPAPARGRDPERDRPPGAPTAAARPGSRRRTERPLPAEVAGELVAAGGARRAARLARDLATAAAAYRAGRYPDAAKLLRPLAETAPTAAGVRELHGLTLYRLSRWRAAIVELDACQALTGSIDQLPVVADCERAVGNHVAVDRRWEELRRGSPGVEILSEGRLVVAGSLADRGRLREAIAVLSRYEVDRARPQEWHLRTWYALADLYERAGDVPRARQLFRRLVGREPEFFDAAERVAALR